MGYYLTIFLELVRERWKWSLAATALILLYFVFVHWAPERQVRVKQEQLVLAIAGSDRDTYTALISPVYRDEWNFDRDKLLKAIRQLNRQFISLQATWTPGVQTTSDSTASATGKIQLTGRGNMIGQEAMTRINRLKNPFTFQWKKESWKPWGWRLVRIDQPDLEIPPDYDPDDYDF